MLDCFRNAAAAAEENFFNNIRRMCNLIKKSLENTSIS